MALPTGATSGYIVWFPDYCNGTGAVGGGYSNCVAFVSPTANDVPAALTFGRGSEGFDTDGGSIGDPAYDFCSGGTVQDARCAAACMRMTYTGLNSTLAGRVGYIEGISREALLTGNSGQPLNVSSIARYSNSSMRTPLDTIENKYRPSEGSQFFRSSDLPEDACYVMGMLDVNTAIGPSTTSGTGMGIGFYWDGLTPDSSFSFDLLKAIEWRPEMSSGIVAPPVVPTKSGGNIVSRSLTYLDNNHPGWQRSAMSGVMSLGAKIANVASSGPGNLLLKAAPMLALL